MRELILSTGFPCSSAKCTNGLKNPSLSEMQEARLLFLHPHWPGWSYQIQHITGILMLVKPTPTTNTAWSYTLMMTTATQALKYSYSTHTCNCLPVYVRSWGERKENEVVCMELFQKLFNQLHALHPICYLLSDKLLNLHKTSPYWILFEINSWSVDI